MLKLKRNIIVEYFDKNALALNLENREVMEFNKKDSWLIAMINRHNSIEQLAEKYIDEFSIPPDQGMETIIKMCKRLWNRNILYAINSKQQGEFMNNTYYIQNPDINVREEDEDGALLFNPDTDQVRMITKTGFYIWGLCSKEHSVSDIVTAFKNDYDDVPEQEIVADVEEFINKMLDAGFLGIVDNS